VTTASVTKISHREALSEALRIEMGRDPNVICIGAAELLSPIIEGLDRVFGEDRILSLGWAERTVVGMAVGMAFEGSRPICELTAAELPSRGLDQLAEAAELHHREGVAVPIVVRVRCGDATAAGASDPEGWLLSIQGLSVVAPATPADAKGLLTSAVRDPGPVCFLEHEDLYEEIEEVPEGGHRVPIGEARLVGEGTRAVVVAYGSGVGPAIRAAAELEAGIAVLDLRTLGPLDRDAVLDGVRRSGKMLLVEETPSFSAVSRLVTATIWEGAFEYLDAPLRRVSLAAAAGEGRDERDAARAATINEACCELLAY
jgi:pyruvate/2-oxoglutarate/acetoin dehydrogenase E1 component